LHWKTNDLFKWKSWLSQTINKTKDTQIMNARENFINEEAESGNDTRTDKVMTDFATDLDDFLDEEVVDKQGAPIGTLACYWQSHSGRLVFLGVKLNGQGSIRVVPGHRSQLDKGRVCIRLGFDAVDIEAAPHFDCSGELDAALERTVHEHFRIAEAQPHGGLRHFARKSAGVGATAGKAASCGCDSPAPEASHPKAPKSCPTK
jgi:hypothetical protein